MPDDICAGIPDCDKDGQTDGGKGLRFLNSRIKLSPLTPTFSEKISQTSAFLSLKEIQIKFICISWFDHKYK